MRGRVLDDPPLSEAVEGEGVVRRRPPHAAGLRDRRAARGAAAGQRRRRDASRRSPTPRATSTPGCSPDLDRLTQPWTTGTVELAGDYRGLTEPHTTPVTVRVVGPEARFGIVSDVDDTILETGVQRVGRMIRQTLDRFGAHPDAVPGRGGALRRPRGRGEPGLLRLLEPLEPARVPGGVPAAPRVPDRARCCCATCSARTPAASRRPAGSARSSTCTRGCRSCCSATPGRRTPRSTPRSCDAYPDRILAVYIREVRVDPADGRVEQDLAGVEARRAVRARRRQRRRTPARRRARPALSGRLSSCACRRRAARRSAARRCRRAGRCR